MKQLTIALTAFFSFLGYCTTAQNAVKPKKQLFIGIKAGVNFSGAVSKNDSLSDGGDLLVGPMGGVYAVIPCGRGFSVQPEVLFNTLGFKVLPYNKPNRKYTFTYVSIPLFLRYNPENSGVALYAGPQVNLRVAASASNDAKFDKDKYKSADFSGAAGAEYFFNNGFNFALRYQYGFSDLLKAPGKTSFLRFHAASVNVGYQFHK